MHKIYWQGKKRKCNFYHSRFISTFGMWHHSRSTQGGVTLEWKEMCGKTSQLCICMCDCRSHSDEKHPSVDVFLMSVCCPWRLTEWRKWPDLFSFTEPSGCIESAHTGENRHYRRLMHNIYLASKKCVSNTLDTIWSLTDSLVNEYKQNCHWMFLGNFS